jgi:hypothetical protein
MAKEGAVLPPERFTASGGFGAQTPDQVDSALVLRAFADGATIVLHELHRSWPTVRAFTRRIGQVRSPAVLLDEFAHFLSSSSERTDLVSSSQESVNFWMPSSSSTVKTSSRSTPASAIAFMTCAASS